MIKTFIIFGMMCFIDPKAESTFEQCYNIIDQPFMYYEGKESCLFARKKRAQFLRETYAKNKLTITEGYVYCLEVNPNVNT